MKPVLILQHLSADGPAYFGDWLQRRGVPVERRNTEAGDAFPERIDAFSALAVLGGEMSANDPLPSLRRAEDLIRQAMAAGRPVIGHCLGGQLMARALGAPVTASPAPEVGWQAIDIADSDAARAWFGGRRQATAFQWHYEAFALPPGAQHLAGSAACPQQAFAIGPHLGMQFHVEIDAAKLQRWAADDGARWLAAQQQHPASVQGAAALRAGLDSELAAHQALADTVYAHWLSAVPRS
ncbi:MAG: type 1 glutamine amidotransferase [Proteobacteria bacterium]|nr:type 1 glutamine amidotransferase [Pseudomonadota bacterium]